MTDQTKPLNTKPLNTKALLLVAGIVIIVTAVTTLVWTHIAEAREECQAAKDHAAALLVKPAGEVSAGELVDARKSVQAAC